MNLNNVDNNKGFLGYIFLLSILFLSCEGFVDVGPPKVEMITSTVYSGDATASSAINGIYAEMMSTTGFASGDIYSITSLTGLSSDEFVNNSTDENRVSFFRNSLLPTTTVIYGSLWEEGYKYIYYANSVIEGLEKSTSLTDTVKSQLEGEAKFIRAFCYFYLTNLWGDIPLVTSIDYRVTSKVSKSPPSLIYDLVISDLKEAQSLLSSNYNYSGEERVRPTKWAATALLSRVFLYKGDWQGAEVEASAVIANTDLFELLDLNSVFLANSREAIWQLMPVIPNLNTKEGRRFIITSTPNHVSLSNHLLNSFEEEDVRKVNWIGSKTISGVTYYYPFKYKVRTGSDLTEYSMVLRLAELYLIRAEARVQQEKIEEAVSDIDAIRVRAGLGLLQETTPDLNKTNVLMAIERERRSEFFAEWGHRWLDLKRTLGYNSNSTTRADEILSVIKGTDWQPSDKLYPIPQTEIASNTNLNPQNPGY